MKKVVETVNLTPTSTPRVRDSSAESARWTKPTIREWNGVLETTGGTHEEGFETSFHTYLS